MSRFYECDWEGEGPPPEFWQQAVKNALRGRKGQAVLRELKEALLALPAPRLIEGYFTKEGEVCPLGALAAKRMAEGRFLSSEGGICCSLADLEEKLGLDVLCEDVTTLNLGESMGLSRALSWAIAWQNDEGSFREETPEKRYHRMMGWIDEHLQQVVA